MLKILRYHELFEKHIENPEYRIKLYFKELEINIREWFESGSLSDSTLIDISISNGADLEKTLIFNFDDVEYSYQVCLIVSVEDVGEEEINSCFIKVKRYNDEGKLIRTYSSDVEPDDINEDKIIAILSELDKKTSQKNDDQTLSDAAMF